MVNYLYPNLKEKVYTIKEYATKNDTNKNADINISDPWGFSIDVYRKCAKEIEENLEKIIDIIQ